jgi:hypothetical protein
MIHPKEGGRRVVLRVGRQRVRVRRRLVVIGARRHTAVAHGGLQLVLLVERVGVRGCRLIVGVLLLGWWRRVLLLLVVDRHGLRVRRWSPDVRGRTRVIAAAHWRWRRVVGGTAAATSAADGGHGRHGRRVGRHDRRRVHRLRGRRGEVGGDRWRWR